MRAKEGREGTAALRQFSGRSREFPKRLLPILLATSPPVFTLPLSKFYLAREQSRQLRRLPCTVQIKQIENAFRVSVKFLQHSQKLERTRNSFGNKQSFPLFVCLFVFFFKINYMLRGMCFKQYFAYIFYKILVSQERIAQ